MSNCAHFKQSTTQEGNDPNIKPFLSEDLHKDETSEILEEIYTSSKKVKVGHKLHVYCLQSWVMEYLYNIFPKHASIYSSIFIYSITYSMSVFHYCVKVMVLKSLPDNHEVVTKNASCQKCTFCNNIVSITILGFTITAV